jgi:predicted cupin superfamily sugar epimerase
MSRLSAKDIIFTLDMQPHPEGGWYAETFRDDEGPSGRGHSSAIYYLLEQGQQSAWHRVDAVEVWHYYAGDPIALRISDGTRTETVTLGPNVNDGQRPQAVVPRGHWQSARSLGSFTLVGCTVAPGFQFSGFELAPAGWEPADAPGQSHD